MLFRKRLVCSFCGSSTAEVSKLATRPKMYICEACVAAASRIIDDNGPATAQSPSTSRIARRRLLLHLVWMLTASSAVYAKEWVPSADDPGDLLGQEPEIKFVTWWAEEKDKNPVKHFPVFKSADATSAIQYCTLNAAATRIDCSKTRNGPVEVTYERQRMNSMIAKQLKEEKRMTPMRSFGCRRGCSKDSPQSFFLMIYEGND
ncbi:MAG TPA: ClpX C4-type zinc finger protein [Bradyrhizobium sp.]|nr:ClpX C4-type zinc finger protein [Bradyrhizobium sp.]